MKLSIVRLDGLILYLLSYVVLVDMINGFFAMEFTKIPLSQIFKLILLALFFIRLSGTKDFMIILLLLLIFQIGPVSGLFKTGNLDAFLKDVVVSTKWFNVPLSFFYFKNLFHSDSFSLQKDKLKRVVKRNFIFISLNMILGILGLGMAFYNEGFQNEIGTRGFIFAGNELTILILALGFIIGMYFFQKGAFKKFLLFFGGFLLISFFITSKTVIGGVVIVYMIPLFATVKLGIKRKWIDWITASVFLGIPLLLTAFYFGITKSGIIDRIQQSLKRNDNDLLTVVLSNRNNFIKSGWEVFANEFSFLGKLVGYGQQYHLELSGHLAEVDFFSLLFSSGIIGLLSLLLIITYWILNANQLRRKPTYPYAKSVLIFLLFLIIAANLSGHVFGSGIAGFFIGLAVALMFYKTENIPL